MVALAYPTPLAVTDLRLRQDQQSSYITVSSELVLTQSINLSASSLPLNSNTGVVGSINTDPDAVGSTVAFEGVGGSIAVNSLLSTSYSVAPTTTLDDVPAATSSASTSKEVIPLGAVIAACVAVGALCVLVVIFFWWRGRKRQVMATDKERWKMHRQAEKSFVGGHPENKEMVEGPWEQFKGSSISSGHEHTPGILPSPPSTGKQYVETGRDYLLANMPPVVKASAGPQSPRRFSVKSTVTGKVNPSNNFASEGHEETLEDEYDFDDAKSGKSRMPVSPRSGHPTSHNVGLAFERARSLVPPLKTEGGDPSSFLSFRSGEMDVESLRQKFTFPPQPSSSVRDMSAAQQTPVPTRTPTQKSQKSGGAVSQHGHVHHVEKLSGNKIALDNLIAALDTPEQRRQSAFTYRSQGDGLDFHQNHIIPLPSTQAAPENPFLNP